MQFKTECFSHQLKEHKRHYKDEYRALIWEQGTGKSKTILDMACRLHEEGLIEGLLIMAPNGVHQNWVVEEIPKHYAGKSKVFLWISSKAKTKKTLTGIHELMHCEGALPILAMNYETVRNKKGPGYRTAERFLNAKKCLMVCDESQRIMTKSSQTTKSVLALSKLAPRRRICTGTVTGNSPFNLFSQFLFLDGKILGHRSLFTFQNRYGIV